MFTEQQRAIFGPYSNGLDEVYGDPLAIYRSLSISLDGEVNETLALMDGPPEKGPDGEPLTNPVPRLQAQEQAIAAARQAFGFLPFNAADGTGATDQQVLSVLRTFCDWMNEQKDFFVS